MHLVVVGSSHNLSTSNIVDISLTHSNNVLIFVVVMGTFCLQGQVARK